MLKRIFKVMNLNLDRVEDHAKNFNPINEGQRKVNLEFKNNLNSDIIKSKKRIDSLRKSIQNTKQ